MSELEDLLGVPATVSDASQHMRFSFLFFSDVRQDVSDAKKYEFMLDVTLFADKNGFEAIYLPERHFHEFGSIHANSAVMASHLIAQTERVRFRTAGVSLPLHHPAAVVEAWAMNDVLSGGRVDLGFGSGWNKADFIYAPEHYENRRQVCSETIPIVQRLWAGESVAFPGPGGDEVSIRVFPRPIQPKLNVWLLVTQNEEGFAHAGRQGYNIFTMLYGNNLDAMAKKVDVYRRARESVGLDPNAGTVTLTLHTLLLNSVQEVQDAVRGPFRQYIKSSLDAHMQARVDQGEANVLSEHEKEKMLDYAYQRYFQTAALFGSVADGRAFVNQAKSVGVDEIACLVDFGVDYEVVKRSLPYLAKLV